MTTPKHVSGTIKASDLVPVLAQHFTAVHGQLLDAAHAILAAIQPDPQPVASGADMIEVLSAKEFLEDVTGQIECGDVASEPVAWTGNGSIMALQDGREGFIWQHKADAHPIPLYAHPATPSSAPASVAEAVESLKPFFGDPVMEGLLWLDATPESLVTIRVQKRIYDRSRAALRALSEESK